MLVFQRSRRSVLPYSPRRGPASGSPNRLMSDPTSPKYRRVLLKLTGEAMGDAAGVGISIDRIHRIASEIREVHRLGVQVGVVVGGGNIFRGIQGSRKGIERATGDQMGMLATVINALALQDALEKLEVPTRVQTAFAVTQMAELFIRRRAVRHLEKGRVVVFAGGTGNPYFSTDTAAALRASEIGAEVILKGTKVDGIYDADPVSNPAATKFDRITYQEAIARRLKVMDTSAFSMCMDNHMPIIVFDAFEPGNIRRIVQGEPLGTLVTD